MQTILPPTSSVLECLEPRLAPAGIITALLSGGSLKLTGDSASNSVSVTEISPDLFRIEAASGTTLTFGTTTGVTTLDFAVTKGLTIDLKDGNDVVQLNKLSLTGDLIVNLGNDTNVLSTQSLQIGGKLTVTGGSGKDTVNLNGESTLITGATTFNMGDGINKVEISSTNTLLDKGLTYTGGTETDTLLLTGTSLGITGATKISLGIGIADVQVENTNANFKGAVTITSLAHVGLTSSILFNSGVLTITGGLTINQGAGINVNTIGSTSHTQITGALKITNGDVASGNASSNTIKSPNFETTGAVTITNGNGFFDNTLSSVGNNIVTIGGKLTITNGNNTGTTDSTTNTIAGNNADIRGGIAITNKNGEFLNTFTPTNLSTGKSAITLINGNVGAGDLTTNIIDPGAYIIAGSVSITNGTGRFTNSIVPIDGEITGGITIKNGNAATSLVTSNTISGNLAIGGSVAITNGSGLYANTLQTTNVIRIGGSLSITNGLNDSGATATLNTISPGGQVIIKTGLSLTNGDGLFTTDFQPSQLHVGGALSITHGNHGAGTVSTTFDINRVINLGSLTIKNGNGLFATNLEASNFTIKGAAAIKNGNTNTLADDTNSRIVASTLNIGGPVTLINGDGDYLNSLSAVRTFLNGNISLTNGAGSDRFDLSASELTIKGNITAKFGAGDTFTEIAGDLLNLTGNISVTALTGNDTLNIIGDGLITGSVNAAFGTSFTTSVFLAGDSEFDPEEVSSLTLRGALIYTATTGFLGGTDPTRRLGFENVNLSTALTYTGGEGIDSFTAFNTHFSKAVKLDLLGANDQVEINNSTFINTFTALTGAGADTILIENISAAGGLGTTTFHSAVSIQTGAGADTLFIAKPGGANAIAIFKAAALFNGGTEANTYTQGTTVQFQGPPAQIEEFTIVPP